MWEKKGHSIELLEYTFSTTFSEWGTSCTRLAETILPLSHNKIHMREKGDWQITANSDQENLHLLSWNAVATANAQDPRAETRWLQSGNNNRQRCLFCTLVLLLTLHSISFPASWNLQYSSYATKPRILPELLACFCIQIQTRFSDLKLQNNLKQLRSYLERNFELKPDLFLMHKCLCRSFRTKKLSSTNSAQLGA